MIKLEIDLRQAAGLRQALFIEQRGYTLDSTSCPQRIVEIRDLIVELDKQIEEELKNETTDA